MIGGTECLSQRDHVLAEKLSLCRTLEVYFKNNVVFKKDRKISKNTNSCLRNRLRVEWWGLTGEAEWVKGEGWKVWWQNHGEFPNVPSTFQKGRWNGKGPSTVLYCRPNLTIKSDNLSRHSVLTRWYLCHIVHWSHFLIKNPVTYFFAGLMYIGQNSLAMGLSTYLTKNLAEDLAKAKI